MDHQKNSRIVDTIFNPAILRAIYIFLVAVFYGVALYGRVASWVIYIPLVIAFIPIVIDGVSDLLDRKITTEFFLIFATGIALVAGQREAITSVLLIMLIAKYIEHRIEDKTEKAIESLIRLIPTQVRLKIGKAEEVIAITQVQRGMQVVIKTGEQIPVDGMVIAGQAQVNESLLTGESIAQEKREGSMVFAGTFVEAGSIEVEAQKIAQDTYLGRISQLLAQAEDEKANIIAVANKAAMVIVVSLIVFILAIWLYTGNLTLVATLLVFGSPIELTLITPLAVLAATAAAFRSGVLVKGSIALERFATVDTVIFDKTGTLTMGEPTVVSVTAVDASMQERELILLAAIVEKCSGHVLAKAILRRAKALSLVIPDPTRYASNTGHGVEAEYAGVTYFLGSKRFIEEQLAEHVSFPVFVTDQQDQSITYFYLASHDKVFGRIGVADVIRTEAKEILQRLQATGISHIILLSGDRQQVAQHIGAQLGIATSYGEVAPDQKLIMIKSLQAKGHSVAMVGDGINDAPALKQANVGIAMGAMGMQPAIAAADIVLTHNDLHGIVFVRMLSKKVMRLIKQNIFFGFLLIHLLGIILALYSLVTPIQAALFHAVSDLLILINSARLIQFSFHK